MISLIVMAVGPSRHVARAVRAAAAQTAGDVEWLIAHASSDEQDVRTRLTAYRRVQGDPPYVGPAHAHLIPVAGQAPGTALNAAVAASRGDAFVVFDGSEQPPATYLADCLAALNPDVAFVAAPGKWWTGAAVGAARPLAAAELLGSIRALSSAALIRRSEFDAAGGFDTSLQSLHLWELLVRMVARGAKACVVPVDAGHLENDDVALLEELRAERHLPSLRRVFDKHRTLFEEHRARVLTDRDQVAAQLWRRERELVQRRNDAQAALQEKVAEVERLREQLSSFGVSVPEWNDLRRQVPVSRYWGLDRGRAVDRYYIEDFLATHQEDIRGRTLEVLNDELSTRFGKDRVVSSDVIDIDPGNSLATVVADLRAARSIADDTYDCFVLTQTLNLIDDMPAAVREACRILKPGGVLLATVPCVSRRVIEYGEEGDYWRVLPAAAVQLFGTVFGRANVTVRARGNLIATTAFLHGLACEDVEPHELAADDDVYPLLVTVRAVKPGTRSAAWRSRKPSAILRHHRVALITDDLHALAVTPDAFRSQLDYLTTKWSIVPARVLAEAAIAGEPLEGAVAITFDDGYLDNLRIAVPILEEFGAPATFFVTSEALDGPPRRFWWDVLAGATVFTARRDPLAVRLDGRQSEHALDTPDARRAAHDFLYPILKRSGPAVRDDIVRQLAAYEGSKSDSMRRPMLASELIELVSREGVEIGAHTTYHTQLATAAPDVLYREVFECRTALERQLHRPVDLFAYPFGSVSAEAARAAQAAGYRVAMTCEARTLRAAERPHRLPRLAQTPSVSGAEFVSWLERQMEVTASR